jgi:hypothetical protein
MYTCVNVFFHILLFSNEKQYSDIMCRQGMASKYTIEQAGVWMAVYHMTFINAIF